MRDLLVLCVSIAMLGCGEPDHAAALRLRPRLWPGLEPGPHAVGFSIRQIRDTSRNFPAGEGTVPRPIQISIWYPGETHSEAPQLTLADYLGDVGTELDFETPAAELQARALAEVRETLSGEGVEPSRLDRSLGRQGLAVRDRAPLPGPFPLILFVPGLGSSPSQSPVLCEFLASHGFVVASIPSLGPRSRETPTTREGIESAVRDLAVALEQMRNEPNVSGAQGVAGYSWGGLTGSFLAMRDAEIDAVASLDGSLMVRQHLETARSVPGYDPSALRQPVMMLLANARQWEARTVEFFERVGDEAQDAFVIRFHDLYHGDFASSIIELILQNLEQPGRDVSRVNTAFAWQCRYLLAFFSTYLKGSEDARAFLAHEPEANGVAMDLMSIQRRAGKTQRVGERQ